MYNDNRVDEVYFKIWIDANSTLIKLTNKVKIIFIYKKMFGQYFI
jgi:hypothetical protein